jgi:D-proline reductase (dithiol) PrdB
VPKLEDLSEIERKAILNFPFMEHDTAPSTTLSRPLGESTLALVTSAGVHLRGDTRFMPGDQTYRVIPSDSPIDASVQSHSSIGFDRVPTYRDMNISVPMDRLRELVERGAVGGLSNRFYSFMGAQRNPRRMVEETGPEVARQLRDDGTDVVLLTPT